MIKYNTYREGALQSLEFTTIDGKKASVGVVEPGEYNFGPAIRGEEITVTSGYITVRGERYGGLLNNWFRFHADEIIQFEVKNGPATYICVYD